MADLKIGRMVIGGNQTNCYFIYKEGATEVICVDPADKGAVIYEKLKEKGYHVSAILLTHGHFDHIWGTKELKELSGCNVYAYEDEQELLGDDRLNVSAQAGRPYTLAADVYLKDKEMLTVAGMTCQVLATPGHTIGSCCYYFEQEKILLSGDTLFQESVGRTDFATGSSTALVRSIQENLAVLPEDVLVYPGHGDETTIGHELQYNPYCQ